MDKLSLLKLSYSLTKKETQGIVDKYPYEPFSEAGIKGGLAGAAIGSIPGVVGSLSLPIIDRMISPSYIHVPKDITGLRINDIMEAAVSRPAAQRVVERLTSAERVPWSRLTAGKAFKALLPVTIGGAAIGAGMGSYINSAVAPRQREAGQMIADKRRNSGSAIEKHNTSMLMEALKKSNPKASEHDLYDPMGVMMNDPWYSEAQKEMSSRKMNVDEISKVFGM